MKATCVLYSVSAVVILRCIPGGGSPRRTADADPPDVNGPVSQLMDGPSRVPEAKSFAS